MRHADLLNRLTDVEEVRKQLINMILMAMMIILLSEIAT